MNEEEVVTKEPEATKEDKMEEEEEEVRPAVSTEEEGQEALWVEEEGDAASFASSGRGTPVKPHKQQLQDQPPPQSRPKRSPFCFGKKTAAAASSEQRSLKKKVQPQVVLLGTLGEAAACNSSSKPTPIDTTAAVTPTAVAAAEDTKTVDEQLLSPPAAASPAQVMAADTISSLGFDKSFELQSNNNSPGGVLSMSSLNEILDGPLTPTAAKAATTVPAVVDYNNTKKQASAKKGRLLRGMFSKKKATDVTASSKGGRVKRSSTRASKKRDVQSFVATVVVDEGTTEEPPHQLDNMDMAVLEMDARLQAAIQTAMDNDDTQSLTSLTGVPVHLGAKDKQAAAAAVGEKPVNFETAKPKFVAAPQGDAEMLLANAKSWDSSNDDGMLNDDAAMPSPPSSDLESPVTTTSTYEDDLDIEPLPSTSPTSTADSSMDRYTVAAETTQIDTSTDESYDDDKYSVLPDPCSFCDSLWISSENHQTVATSLSDSPDSSKGVTTVESSTPRLVKDLDVDVDTPPPTDKYAELPEVIAASSSGLSSCDAAPADVSVEEKQVTQKSPARSPNPGLVAGLFGKLKRTPSKESKAKKTTKQSKKPSSKSSINSTPSAIKATPKKSILKDKKVLATANIEKRYEQAPEKTLPPAVTDPITVISNEATLQYNKAPTEDAASTEGSSTSVEEEAAAATNPLAEHIKKRQQQRENHPRGMDPATAAAKQMVGHRMPLDP
jgi:hypothetical protein